MKNDKRVTVKIAGGHLSTEQLEKYLQSEALQEFLKENSACGLIEYYHRFCLLHSGLIEELNKEGEIASYGTRGRIFWHSGQVFFRRTEETIQFMVLCETDNSALPPLPETIHWASERQFYYNDRNLLMWGTYSTERGGYVEERVAGHETIDYPQEVGRGKYPVLRIREYLDDKFEIFTWRFLELTSLNEEQLLPDRRQSDGQGL